MPSEYGWEAALVAAGAALGKAVDWLLSLRRDRRDAATAAVEALRATMEELREEVERLREAEQSCRRENRLHREDMHFLRNHLMRAGLQIPPLPSEAPGALARAD